MSESSHDGDGGRRDALRHLVVLGSAALGCAIAAPAAVFLAAPVKVGAASRERWIKTMRLAALDAKAPKKVSIVASETDAYMVRPDVELGAVWLVREGDGVKAYSVVCPHLGCSVNAIEGGGFGCPCHTSSFDANGKKVSGPSPRDMDGLATKIEDGFVWVDFRRFRIGTDAKEPIG